MQLLIFILGSLISLSYSQRKAECVLYPSYNQQVKGYVTFWQESPASPTKIQFNLTNLPINSYHAFHIHQLGALSTGCGGAAGHFNPFNKKHGDRTDTERHAGDLGNLQSDENGNIITAFEDKIITLFGSLSILGRSCMLHQNKDDLGKGEGESHCTGNAGPRIGCGVIGMANEWYQEYEFEAAKHNKETGLFRILTALFVP